MLKYLLKTKIKAMGINYLSGHKRLSGGKRNQKFALIIFLFITNLCHAQLERFPVHREAAQPVSQASKNSTARTKQQADTLTLPFWDDFSTPYLGMYPDTIRWQDSFTIWVNDGMAINPPTVNVATFDGLDSAGMAYNPNEILLKGFTDSLTSSPINLSVDGVGAVLPAERSSVYLSFFYQWRGNGEAPDEGDYIVLQFYNAQKKWITVLTIIPQDNFERSLFYSAIVAVTAPEYFHAGFQFRFKSFGRQSGPYDTWNIDYVYLNKGRNINDLSFPDQAVASSLTTLFPNNYAAMPYLHFKQNPVLVAPKFDVYNLRDFAPEVVNYIAEANFTNYKDNNSTVIHISNLKPGTPPSTGINDDGSGGIPAFERRTVTLKHLPNVNDPSQFNPEADSIFIDLKVNLNTGDDIDSTGQTADDYLPIYSPIKFRVNDTIQSHYVLKDYYAYDDGKAEYAAGLLETGNLAAYQFDMPFTDNFKQDTLIAFDIYLPPFGMSANQTVDFFIYPDSLGKPDSKNALRIPSRPLTRKGVNEFQRIKFLPALLITQNKFYIGWKEPIAGRMLVGLDISNNTGDKIFVNTNGPWYQNDRVNGSLMIRPVFGSGIIETQTGVEEELQFAVYPNPSRGNFYIDGHVDRLQILSITGQPVSFEAQRENEKTFVQMNQPAGLYLLRYSKGKITKTHKLIVSQ